MRKIIVSLTALLALNSCKKEAKSIEKAEAFQLEFLFEKDGCKVYRFWDGRYIYWASCAGSIQYEQHTQSGKSHSTQQIQEFTTK